MLILFVDLKTPIRFDEQESSGENDEGKRGERVW